MHAIRSYYEKVYFQTKKNTGNSYYSELANLYAAQMKKEEMIVAYLNYIVETPSSIAETIINRK